MICPHCKVTETIVQNNNYFCPSCAIYIGPANEINKNYSPAPWKTHNVSNPLIIEEQTTKKIGLKGYLFKYTILFLIISVFLILNNLSNYISLFPYCRVAIQSNIRGNKQTIIKALNLIKNESTTSYTDVCTYVEQISEQKCAISDSRGQNINGTLEFRDSCYIRGSKIIYIQATQDISENTIKLRAESIKNLAKFSKDYWKQKK